MKARRTIFLSGVSHEFGTFRDAVENEVQTKGCFPLNQPSFGPDYQTVEEMLTRKLTDSDAVIHIVGFRFGAEPNLRPPGIPRRSYTQMEFDIARKVEKPVFIFVSNDASVRQPPQPGEQPEDDGAVRLQLAHRDAVTKTNYLYYFFKDQAALCKLVAEIPPVAAADFHADISRIIKYAPPQLIGRENETKLLDDAWLKVRRAESARPHVFTFVALGGEGKTSLVAKWAAELAHQDWPGCDAVFAWSFYSQGTREQTAVSADLFLAAALTFFGDPAMAGSAQGAFDKGRRLAQLVGELRALLILDGLEPLQYAPTSPTPGELKDQGLAALLKGLAATNNGLCVVTTRYSIPDLRAYWETTAPETNLLRLSKEAGVALLRSLGVKGTQQEFETLIEDVKGHALTLNLLGAWLHEAHAGDIRKRDLVKLEEADAEEQGGHAFRVLDAYVRWFESRKTAHGELGRGLAAVGHGLVERLEVFAPRSATPCIKRADRPMGTCSSARPTKMRAKRSPEYPLLYSMEGFIYCDLLLDIPERAAWQLTLDSSFSSSPESLRPSSSPASCRAVSERAAQTLKIEEENKWLLYIALDHLTLGRAALYAAILESSGSDFGVPCSELVAAVAGLRRAGQQDQLPKALLTRAWLRFLTDQRIGSDSAQRDLDEAWEIAERGPMPLFLADIHLHRARLFFREQPYPWGSPQADLADARRLIEKHGYWRRKEELEDAEAALNVP